MFKAYTQYKQDEMYEKMVKMNRAIFNTLIQKGRREELNRDEVKILDSVSKILGEIDTY